METRKKELSVLPVMLNHKGFDCKIYALAGVLGWLYETKQINTPPAPARKREEKDYQSHSLRWYLKHEFNSAVGEAHNVVDLGLLAEKHAEVTAHFAECEDKQEYFKTVMFAIDQGLAPIVFFDKDYESDYPAKLDGKMEHAAILVGYFFDEKNVLFFKITQFGKYFNFKAQELFDSTQQLPKSRTIQENYFKLYRKDEGAWLPESYAKINKWANLLEKRQREKNPTKGNGCNKKVLIIDSKIHPRLKLANMPAKFKRPTFSVDSSEDLIRQINDTEEDKQSDEKAEINQKIRAINNMYLLSDDRPSLISGDEQTLRWNKVKKPSSDWIDAMWNPPPGRVYLYSAKKASVITNESEDDVGDYLAQKNKTFF